MTEPFDLRPVDFDILAKIGRSLVTEDAEFSADTLFALGLDKLLDDTQHGAGGWFARMQHHGFIMPVGRKRSTRPSNHSRVIRTFRRVKKDE